MKNWNESRPKTQQKKKPKTIQKEIIMGCDPAQTGDSYDLNAAVSYASTLAQISAVQALGIREVPHTKNMQKIHKAMDIPKDLQKEESCVPVISRETYLKKGLKMMNTFLQKIFCRLVRPF